MKIRFKPNCKRKRRKAMKGKGKIELKVNRKLKELCERYGVTVKQLLLQFQKDIMSCGTPDEQYQGILAELYLAEIIANRLKVDRSSVESVLDYMKKYNAQQSREHNMLKGLSKVTKQILKENNYKEKHTKN